MDNYFEKKIEFKIRSATTKNVNQMDLKILTLIIDSIFVNPINLTFSGHLVFKNKIPVCNL